MPQSLPDTTPPKRRFRWPTGMPQLAALLLVLLVDSLVAPHFWQVVLQDGRLFGSPIDILNRAAPVALLAIGMTLVIATGGIDLSVGAVMAIAGATTAAMTVAGFSLPIVLLSALGTGILAGLWNGILVAILKIQPFVATLILMVAGRGVAQLITAGQIVTFNSPDLSWFGSGSLLFLPTPVIIAVLTLILFLAVDPQNGAGDVYRSRWYQHSGGKKCRGKHANHRHAHLCVERAVCGDCGHYRGGGYSRCRCQQRWVMAGAGRHSRGGDWRRIADGRAL